MPGLGYLQGEPLHPITWASQQHSGIGEKLHPSSDGPPEDQAWSNGRGDFFFLIILLCCGEKGLLSPPTSILFFKSGAPSFLVRLHSFCFLPPRSSRGAHWNIKPPCMTICTCMDLKTRRRWVFGWVCVWVCFCALSCVFFDGSSSLHTHTYIYTHMRPSMGKPTVQCSVIVGYAWLGGGWVWVGVWQMASDVWHSHCCACFALSACVVVHVMAICL